MKKILLIEDNDDIRNNTGEILELSNYLVITAENGKSGIEKALAERPDLIICDIMMPLLDGYGVFHAVHKNEATKNTPFIFLTAKTDRINIRRGMDLGADDYITKPFLGSELLNAVESRLAKIDQLKKEFSASAASTKPLAKITPGTNPFESLIESRNTSKYKKKQLIYAEGNHPYRLFYIIKGKVKIFRSNEEGKELVTDLNCDGDFLGHIALLEGTPYKNSAETMEETELAIIPKEEFDELINRSPEVAGKFIQLLARNIAEKEKQLLDLAYNSLRKKVANALVKLQKKYGKNSAGEYLIDINRESLATIAGTATESLIRTLSDFKGEKLIETTGGGILILDMKKMENLVN